MVTLITRKAIIQVDIQGFVRFKQVAIVESLFSVYNYSLPSVVLQAYICKLS